MEIVDFSQPRRQSSLGIIVIFGFKLFQFFKRFFVAFLAIGFSILRKKSPSGLSTTIIFSVLAGILIIILITAILKYLNFKFYLTKNDFHLSRGIINKDSTIIPKSKIQNVYIKQNFLQQLINVVSVNIETAGDKKSEIEISALDRPTALLLKDALFDKENIGTKEHSDTEPKKSNVYFKVSVKRLLLAGLSHNHFKSFAIIIGFFVGLYYQFKDVVKELKLGEHFEGFLKFNEEILIGLAITNIILVVMLMLVSVLFSVIALFIVNFNLEVIEHKKTIEINKGLFNKVSLILTPSRIQNIIIKTNRVKRYFGLHTLYVKQTMVNQKQQKNFNIIALEKHQVSYLVGKLLSGFSFIDSRKIPRPYFMRIAALKAFWITIVINCFMLLLFGVNALFINLLLVPISFLFVVVSYKKSYYSITDEFVTVGSGFIDTVTNILEIHKIQSVKLRQSIFQKRRNIASVIITTASKPVTIPYINEKEAKNLNDFLLFKVESQAKDWM